jgi:hypothetical protein
MITTTHLIMVRVYLKQELPIPYNDLVTIEDDKIIITLPDNGKSFNTNYDEVFNLINDNVARIRNRECNYDFRVKGVNQLRDFKIYEYKNMVSLGLTLTIMKRFLYSCYL